MTRSAMGPAAFRRTLVEIVAAALAAVAFHVVTRHDLLLSPDDPFRTSLLILPLVVAALRAIERWAREVGRGRWNRRLAHPEAVVLGLLLLLTLSRRSLGLAASGAKVNPLRRTSATASAISTEKESRRSEGSETETRSLAARRAAWLTS